MMGNIDICETCRLHSSPCLTDDKEIPFADELCSSICFRERASSHIFVLCSLTTCDAARRRTLSKTSFTFPLSSMHSTHHSPHPRTPQKQGCHTPERSSSRTRRKDARDHTSLHERKRSTPSLVEKRASHVSCTFDRISNCKAVSLVYAALLHTKSHKCREDKPIIVTEVAELLVQQSVVRVLSLSF